MTSDMFRQIALSMGDATEAQHMSHPDFRTAGKIFATLGSPSDDWGMVKLAPEEQAVLVAAEPSIFAPANGAWGRQGSTLVRLAGAPEPIVRRAIELAWNFVTQQARAKKPARAKRPSRGQRPTGK